MPNILLIGAGQLGSRHLQALAKSESPLAVDVVDPFPGSLATAKARFEEISQDGRVTTAFHEALPKGRQYAVAIIATNADVRAAITKRLLDETNVRAILFEKVLFQRLEDYALIGSLLRDREVMAWVNCPRRMYPAYRELRGILGGRLRLTCLEGAVWNMACNAVHFADLAAFLSGEKEFDWDTSGLDPELLPCKREGFSEISGVLRASSKSGTSIELVALKGSSAPRNLHILGERGSAWIDEGAGLCTLYRADAGWKAETFPFRMYFQSELTHLAVERILYEGRCELPGFEESCQLHVPLVRALLGHMRSCGLDGDICPIT